MDNSTELNETSDTNSSTYYYYYYTIDYLLASYGSTWFLDNFNLYCFTLLGGIGIILNIYSFIIFLHREFNIPLYKYLQVYVINNFVMCLLNKFNFVFCTPRIFSWSNSYYAQLFYARIYVPVTTTSYVFGACIDIAIQLDRISTFSSRIKSCLKLSPYKACLIMFIVSVIIELPDYFGNMPNSSTSRINATKKNFNVW
jgi:hypothetical protein